MDETKFNSNLKFWGIALGILQGISTVASFLTANIITILSAIMAVVLIILFIALTKKKSMAGPIIGIVLGALYILSFDIVSLVIGILLILDCIKFVKYIN